MSFALALENDLLDKEFGAVDFTPPATHYAALSTTTPNEDGGNFTEPSGNGYTRVAITNNKTTGWNNAASGALDNKSLVQFPVALGSWGTVTHVGLYTASVGGTIRAHGALATSKAIDTDDQLEFAAGAIDVTLD